MKRAQQLTVADLMTKQVFTVTAGQSLVLAEAAMNDMRVRHIPVVDGERHVLGLVTHRDLLQAKISELSPMTAVERGLLELKIPVAEIMQTAVWTVAPETPALNAAQLLSDHRFGCLPVVKATKLVGIVTEHDFLQLITDSLDVGEAAGPLTVGMVMTPLPVVLQPQETLGRARDLMDAHQIRHLPIVDEHGTPLGVISDRDLQVAEAIVGRNSDVRAGLLGSKVPFKVSSGAPLAPVLLNLASQRLGSALEVDEGRLIGIFTTVDACRVFGKHLQAPSEPPPEDD